MDKFMNAIAGFGLFVVLVLIGIRCAISYHKHHSKSDGEGE